MNRAFSYFNRPASYNTKPWIIVVVASLLVGFLLGFLQPFGISNLSTTTKYFLVIGFTMVTALSTSIVGYLFPYLFKKIYDPLNWTIGKSLTNQTFLILLIALGNFGFDWIFTHRQPDTFFPVLLSYILVTFLIGIIPVTISFFIIQNLTLKRNLNEAKIMNDRLAEHLQQDEIHTNSIETKTIVLSGNTKESITLYPDTILYLESSGNYVKVNYLLDNVVKQKQLRTAIGQIEEYLRDFPYLLRCHRAYMVNISFVTNIEGNSQGLQLHLRYIKEEIPVSRSYSKTIRESL